MTTDRLSLPVTNFVWVGDRFDPEPPVAGGASSRLSELCGQFAFHVENERGTHELIRDALGVNKLFFAIDDEERVDASNYWIDLVRRGHRADRIWSVPSGHRIRLEPRTESFELTRYSTLTFGGADDGSSPSAHAGRIRAALEATFRRLKTALVGRPLFVTLSGGLDSTTIAVLAREWLGEFVGVTFSTDEDPGRESQDLRFARRVARDLGVRLETVRLRGEEVVDLLDTALLYGQDWRDFNVHCALVNASIGRALRDLRVAGSRRPVILSGDTANELLADYGPVRYADREFYTLPGLAPGRLRRFLVGGLDSGDREIGVLAHYGMDVIQPFALIAPAYAALPGAMLGGAAAKQTLTRRILGDRIPPYVYARPKVRAQVGGSERVGGTLAALVDRGIDEERLAQRFAELFGLDRTELGRMIRGGFYRFPTEYPR